MYPYSCFYILVCIYIYIYIYTYILILIVYILGALRHVVAKCAQPMTLPRNLLECLQEAVPAKPAATPFVRAFNAKRAPWRAGSLDRRHWFFIISTVLAKGIGRRHIREPKLKQNRCKTPSNIYARTGIE